jgi:hypothetical protein
MNHRTTPRPYSSSHLAGRIGSMPNHRNICRSASSSKALSPTRASGFCLGRPGFPATAAMSTTSGKSVFTSCRLAGANCMTSGTPLASVNRQCLLPERPRSVGLGHVLARPAELSPNCNRRVRETNRVGRLPEAWLGTTRACVAKVRWPSSRQAAWCTFCLSAAAR